MLNPSSNSNYQNDCKFVLNLIAWLNGGDNQQTYYLPLTTTIQTTKTTTLFNTKTTTFTTTYTSTQTQTQTENCTYTPTFSTSTSSISTGNTSSTNKHASFAFLSSLIVLPIIAIIKRQRKHL